MSRRILIFVPGILGTEIKDKAGLVWPPRAGDILRQDQLLDRIVGAKSHGNPIRSAYCRNVYEAIWTTLSAIDQANDDLLFLPMGFDWRLDIVDTAQRLGEDISRAIRGTDKRNLEIVIVAHSMGGLVVRTLLEQGLKPSWAKYVRAAIFIGTPHNGAPRAAAAALGLVSVQGIRAKTLRKYVESGKFQSFLGLMPSGDSPYVQNWDGSRFSSAGGSVAICRELGSDPKKVFRHWNTLRTQGYNKPENCLYFCIGNGNVQTVAALARQTSGWSVLERLKAGDDTVPMHSAFLPSAMNYSTAGNHLKICETTILPQLVTMALGLPATFQPFAGAQDRAMITASPEDAEAQESIDIHVWSDCVSDIAIEVTKDDSILERVNIPPVDHIGWTYIPKHRGPHVARVVQNGTVLDQDTFFVHDLS